MLRHKISKLENENRNLQILRQQAFESAQREKKALSDLEATNLRCAMLKKQKDEVRQSTPIRLSWRRTDNLFA